jgi:hypothetical protein
MIGSGTVASLVWGNRTLAAWSIYKAKSPAHLWRDLLTVNKTKSFYHKRFFQYIKRFSFFKILSIFSLYVLFFWHTCHYVSFV